jgi:hypothetical protein
MWRDLLKLHQQKYRRPLLPVKHRTATQKVPDKVVCPHCKAPARYLYFNDGKIRSQIRREVCNGLAQIHKRFRTPPKQNIGALIIMPRSVNGNTGSLLLSSSVPMITVRHIFTQKTI